MSRNAKAIAFLIAAIALAAAAYFAPVREWIAAGIAWTEANRGIAWPAFIVTYIIATVLLIPGSIVTLGAGFVFGLPLGVVLVSVASVAGACAAFLVGRFLARDWVQAKIADLPRFRAVYDATETDGMLIVFLIRLSPLFPFNLVNYALGLTAVRFGDYLLASWIGMLPGTILYVYIGTLAQNLAELTGGGVEAGLAGRLLFFGGFAATLVLTLIVTRRATRALSRRLDSSADRPA